MAEMLRVASSHANFGHESYSTPVILLRQSARPTHTFIDRLTECMTSKLCTMYIRWGEQGTIPVSRCKQSIIPVCWEIPDELAEIVGRLSFPIGVIRDRTLHRIPSSFALHNKARCDWTACSFSNQVAVVQFQEAGNQ